MKIFWWWFDFKKYGIDVVAVTAAIVAVDSNGCNDEMILGMGFDDDVIVVGVVIILIGFDLSLPVLPIIVLLVVRIVKYIMTLL